MPSAPRSPAFERFIESMNASLTGETIESYDLGALCGTAYKLPFRRDTLSHTRP